MNKPTAFVIMPFSKEFDHIYTEVIGPALEETFDYTRADQLTNAQNIVKDILQHINQADLIVADLTGRNANVFYELGLAHAFGIRTILMARAIKDLPFNLTTYRIIEYGHLSTLDATAELKKYIDGYVSGTTAFGSPVSEILNVPFRTLSHRRDGVAVDEHSRPDGGYTSEGVRYTSPEVRPSKRRLWSERRARLRAFESEVNSLTAEIAEYSTATISKSEELFVRSSELRRSPGTASGTSAFSLEHATYDFAQEVNVRMNSLKARFATIDSYITRHVQPSYDPYITPKILSLTIALVHSVRKSLSVTSNQLRIWESAVPTRRWQPEPGTHLESILDRLEDRVLQALREIHGLFRSNVRDFESRVSFLADAPGGMGK